MQRHQRQTYAQPHLVLELARGTGARARVRSLGCQSCPRCPPPPIIAQEAVASLVAKVRQASNTAYPEAGGQWAPPGLDELPALPAALMLFLVRGGAPARKVGGWVGGRVLSATWAVVVLRSS